MCKTLKILYYDLNIAMWILAAALLFKLMSLVRKYSCWRDAILVKNFIHAVLRTQAYIENAIMELVKPLKPWLSII